MPLPNTYVCPLCLKPVESVAKESHNKRHEDMVAFGRRRNVWTPADQHELSRMKLTIGPEEQ